MKPARTKADTTFSRRPRELLLRLRRTRWADCDICRSLPPERTKLQSQRMHIAKLHETQAALFELDQTALAEVAGISAAIRCGIRKAGRSAGLLRGGRRGQLAPREH